MTASIKVLVLMLVALGGVLVFASSSSAQTGATVAIGDFYFCDPANEGGVCTTEVEAGGTVTWNFGGAVPHTVTGSGFDSGQQSSGSFSQTFNEAGTFAYQCNIHPTQMQGEIVVTAAQEPDPDEPVDSDDATDDGNGGAGDGTGDDATTDPEVSEAPTAGTGPMSGGGVSAWLIAAITGIGVAFVGAGLLFAGARTRD